MIKRSIIQFALVVAVVVAFPVDDDKYVLNVFNSHHYQHRESVDAAKQGMNERLAQLQRSLRIQGCTSCSGESFSQTQSSRLSSSRSSSNSQGLGGSDYVGVGYVGHSDNEDTQRRISPLLSNDQTHNRYSSSNTYHEEEEEDVQQRQVVPTYLHGIQSSAYRSSANREEEEDTQKTIGIGYHDASVSNDGSYLRRTQQQREQYESESTRSTPKVIYVSAPASSSSHRHASNIASESEYQETRPTTQRVTLQVRPGTTTVLQVPIRVNSIGVPESGQQYNSNSRSSGYQQTVQQQVLPTQKITYYVPPITSKRHDASRSGSEISRTIYVQPEKYVAPDLTAYNSYGSQSRSHIDDELDVQTRVGPQSTSIIDVGSSRYASSSSSHSENAQRSQTRVVPAIPIQTVDSSSSRRTAEEQRERQSLSSRPNYYSRTPITAEESRRTEGSSSYGSSGSTILHRPGSSNSQINSRLNLGGNNFSPYSPSYAPTRHSSGAVSANNDNLHEYMSESQRLAEMQQRQIASSSQRQYSSSFSNAAEANRRTLEHASKLDSTAANFVHSQNLANRNSEFEAEDLGGQAIGNGGYQRVKSWQKQAKWESGSQYGTDGKPKTYSMLSTAEAEKHNINGQSTGYKAATTTLENDGKVSTYSIHTP